MKHRPRPYKSHVWTRRNNVDMVVYEDGWVEPGQYRLFNDKLVLVISVTDDPGKFPHGNNIWLVLVHDKLRQEFYDNILAWPLVHPCDTDGIMVQ